MRGLGDNVFQRPFVRAVANRYDVWMQTPWPELYQDLGIHFAIEDSGRWSKLRTQTKNVLRQKPERWSHPPEKVKRVTVEYSHGMLVLYGSIPNMMESQLPLHGEAYINDLPDYGPPPIKSEKPIAFIRPATVRKEWRNEARNCEPEYIAEAARQLMASHHVVVVADLLDGEEWLVGDMPPYHQAFLKGELPIEQLFALVRHSDIVVGPVGWIVPVSIAYKVRLLCILGGHGSSNAPQRITWPRMDLSRVTFVKPERFCAKCTNMRHTCDKTISHFDKRLAKWLALEYSSGSPSNASHGFPTLESVIIPSADSHTTGATSTNTLPIATPNLAAS